ncbi:MAG: molecular chaperone DnaJ [Candidatus Peribacteraceae bacterium]
MAKDYYAILGVQKTATEADLKQAYRRLSRELHPDKHKGDPSDPASVRAGKEKEAKFKEVNEAYDVLSDPKKRQAYDQFGTADAAGFGGGQGFSGFSGFSGFDPSAFAGGDFADLFESFFGGGAGRRRRETDNRGRAVEVELTISFADAVTGMEREVTLRTHVTCADCSGSGGEKGSKLQTCSECGGAGAVTRTSSSLFGMIRQSVLCPSCRGSGKVPERSCKRCSGEGRTMERKTLTVRILKGIDDGQTLRITGEGEAGRQGGASGDLLVHIRVEPDSRFLREGDDIRSTVKAPITDAVLGGRLSVLTVHGTMETTIPAGTQPGQILRLKGKGMPVLNTSRFGDHYVTVNVEIPTKLSRRERELLEELKRIGG